MNYYKLLQVATPAVVTFSVSFIIAANDASIAAITLRKTSACICRSSNIYCRETSHATLMLSCSLDLE